MQDLVRLSITNMDIDDMTADIVASYNIMLKSENFKPYHEDIKIKLEEYNKANGVSDKKHEGFKIELKVCTYYKTINNFIVMISGQVGPNIEMMICKLGTPITPKQTGIFGSKISDANFKLINTLGTRFHINDKGKFVDMEDCEHFGLHIVSKVDVSFHDLKEQKA